MKKLLLLTTILISSTVAFAQKDVEAKKILNAVSLKYKSYNMIKADFTFLLDDPMSKIKDTQTGTLVTQPKLNKFKVTIYDPTSRTTVAREVISDGKSQWTYAVKDKEAELSDVDHSEDN